MSGAVGLWPPNSARGIVKSDWSDAGSAVSDDPASRAATVYQRGSIRSTERGSQRSTLYGSEEDYGANDEFNVAVSFYGDCLRLCGLVLYTHRLALECAHVLAWVCCDQKCVPSLTFSLATPTRGRTLKGIRR